jgi:tetratricopeptide (TPR) repeat protein
LSDWKNRRVHALAAIAKPQLFFDGLREQGLELGLAQAWPDHNPLLEFNPAVAEATRRKQLGNEALMRTEAVKALHEYTNAMTSIWTAAEALQVYLTSNTISPADAQRLSHTQKDIDDLRVVLLCNQALASIKIGNFQQAIEFCNTVLAFQSGNQKALFRRGFARARTGELVAAEEDYRRILAVDPDNTEALKEIRNLKRIRQEPQARYCSQSGFSWDSVLKACAGLNRKEQVVELEMTKIRG